MSDAQRTTATVVIGSVLLTLGALLLVVSAGAGIPLFGNPEFIDKRPMQATSLGLNILARLAVFLAGLRIIFRPSRAGFLALLALGLCLITASFDTYLFYDQHPWNRSAQRMVFFGSLAAQGIFVLLLVASLFLTRKRPGAASTQIAGA